MPMPPTDVRPLGSDDPQSRTAQSEPVRSPEFTRSSWKAKLHWIACVILPVRMFPEIPKGWKAKFRWVGLRIVMFYLVLVTALAVLQRSLIYGPSRFATIDTRQAGLPEGFVHDIVINTDDQLQLHGWHFVPGGRACKTASECDAALADAKRLILFFPGNAGTRIIRSSDCRSFADGGSNVFIFDYRGYAENAGSPSENALARDSHAFWKYATTERKVPANRIVLYGESLGGAVAVRLASDLCAAGTPPAGLIVRSSFSSLADTAAYHHPWAPVRLLLLDRYPSSSRALLLTCPLLQFHGMDDDIVPLELGRRLFDAVPEKSASGIPKRLAEIPTKGHNDLAVSNSQPLVQSFLDRLQ